MKEINLKGLNNPLLFVTGGKSIEIFPSEDLENDEDNEENNGFTETETYKIYQDKINNNVVIYSYYSLDEEEIPTDIVQSISDYIRNDVYNYLINALNNSKNTIVYWSQVEGTTSDYTIYYDVKIPNVVDYESIYKMTIDLSFNDKIGYKYVEVKNGKYSKIEV